MVSWGDRGWMVVAGVGGAVSLAMVGAPLSVDMIFLVGPDHPSVIGEQFAALFTGAIATATATMLAGYWRWLLVAGTLGMLVAHAIRAPKPQGLSIQVRQPGSTAPVPDIAAHTVWVCLLVAAASVLLVGVLGVAQELGGRLAACVAGFAGCAAFFGVSIVGRLRGIEATGRIIVVGALAAITLLAVLRSRATGNTLRWPTMVAAVAALVWLLPTLIVAIRNQAVFGTVTGGVVGLTVLAVAIAAARPAGLPGMLMVGATGLVLAAPVIMLTLLYDVLLTGVWYAWPIAIAGVLAGVAAAAGPWALRAGIVAAAGVSMIGLAARMAEDRSTGELVIWLFLALSMAAVAATVGSAAQVFARVQAIPAIPALGTLAALGVFGTLNLLRAGGRSGFGGGGAFGSTMDWTVAALMVVAAGTLLFVGRRGVR